MKFLSLNYVSSCGMRLAEARDRAQQGAAVHGWLMLVGPMALWRKPWAQPVQRCRAPRKMCPSSPWTEGRRWLSMMGQLQARRWA